MRRGLRFFYLFIYTLLVLNGSNRNYPVSFFHRKEETLFTTSHKNPLQLFLEPQKKNEGGKNIVDKKTDVTDTIIPEISPVSIKVVDMVFIIFIFLRGSKDQNDKRNEKNQQKQTKNKSRHKEKNESHVSLV